MCKDTWLPKEVKKRANLCSGIHPKRRLHEKDMLEKNKLSRINFQCQESGLFIPETYPSLGAIPDDVISCNYYGEEILEIKSP